MAWLLKKGFVIKQFVSFFWFRIIVVAGWVLPNAFCRDKRVVLSSMWMKRRSLAGMGSGLAYGSFGNWSARRLAICAVPFPAERYPCTSIIIGSNPRAAGSDQAGDICSEFSVSARRPIKMLRSLPVISMRTIGRSCSSSGSRIRALILALTFMCEIRVLTTVSA